VQRREQVRIAVAVVVAKAGSFWLLYLLLA